MEALLDSFSLPAPVEQPETPSAVASATLGAPLPSQVIVRAINPDNHQEAEKLVQLFVESFSHHHPLRSVYDTSFWLSPPPDVDEESVDHLTSIVAEDQGRFIAHLALRRDSNDPRRAEVLLPAVHPAYRKHMFRITRGLWSVISKCVEKQGLNVVYHFSSVLNPACQLMSVKCFHSTEVSLISTNPAPATPTEELSRPERRASALLFYNLYGPEEFEELPVYAPPQHLARIQSLFSTLKLPRVFGETDQQIIRRFRPLPNSCFASEEFFHGLHIAPLPSDTTWHPEMIRSFVLDLKVEGRGKPVVAVCLQDPKCPIACESLEQIGLRFCGILPTVAGRDFILYSELLPELFRELPLYSRNAQALKTYVTGYPKRSGIH